MEADAPKNISKYDVVDLIGRGGMGVVYKAVDRALDRLVAIKMVTGAAEQGELLKRFYREAQFTANLRHPNIVIVYDLGAFEGRPYLVMEYLDGQSLESMLATKTITMLQTISYVRQICSGLEYAHSRQPSIIHRDIKPANIVVLADGSVKIVDFGIARLVHSRHTQAGQLMGSFHYMSPEQINDVDLDGRSDVFSTGVVLYQLLTSKLPFEGSGIAQTLNRIVGSPAPPLSQFIQGYPPALDHIVARALAKERDERYPSASEFSFDLLEVEEHFKSSLFGEYISRAERLLRDGKLDRAKQELLNVLQIDREHVRANELMRQLVQAIAKKPGCLEEAIRPENTNRELQTARDQEIAARARMEKLNEVLSRAERAYSTGDLEGASRSVDEAFDLDPDAARAKALNVQIAHKVAEREQERRVQELLALARRHIPARKFADALEAVKKAESLNPAAPGIRDLMALAASGHEQEQRRRAVEKAAAEILAALDGSDPSLARKLTQAAVQQFPNEDALLQLKARAERQVARQAEGIAAELGSSSPGRQRRPETMPVKVVSPLDRSSSPDARHSSHKPVESLRSKSSAESSNLPKANPATAYTTFGRISGWGDDLLKKVETQLATFLGPLATILVKKAASKTTDPEELYRLLAANLEQESDRRAFLARRAEIAYSGTKRQTMREPLSSAHSGTSAAPGSKQEITPAAIDHAARVLAHYVGPISGVLTKKAAQRADSLRTLYLLLAEHVESKQERDRFLRDTGFPNAQEG